MKKALVLGDKNVVFSSLATICRDYDYKVQFVENGAEALGSLLIDKYELIITPMFLERVNAIEILKTVYNTHSINEKTPVVLVTSETDLDEVFGENYKPDYILPKDGATIDLFKQVVENLETQIAKKEKVKVLYIDDDKLVRMMVELMIKKIPYVELQLCQSLEELKGLKQLDFQIIATDHLLEDGDSSDVVSHITQVSEKEIPVLVYTATTKNVDINTLKETGHVIDVLPKPFDLKGFLMHLEEVTTRF